MAYSVFNKVILNDGIIEVDSVISSTLHCIHGVGIECPQSVSTSRIAAQLFLLWEHQQILGLTPAAHAHGLQSSIVYNNAYCNLKIAAQACTSKFKVAH